MHQIAKMAKIGQASLYRRYSEKGQICMEIVSEEGQPLLGELQAYLNQSSDDSPLERLYQVIVKFIYFLEVNSPWLSNVNRASVGYCPLQSPLFK
jgi:AcrR family transcriptional regulator